MKPRSGTDGDNLHKLDISYGESLATPLNIACVRMHVDERRLQTSGWNLKVMMWLEYAIPNFERRENPMRSQ